jgi:DNA-binding response OmpR family regulator
VLVVEDDLDLRRALVRYLSHAGYVVDHAATVVDADLKLSVHDYDAAVCDRMLPDGDAIDLVAAQRAAGRQMPLLFLTARDAVPDRVAGLHAGADDYLIKPFDMEELVARVHALVRRGPTAVAPTLSVGDVVVDQAQAVVSRGGSEVATTAKEYALLRYLMSNAGRVVSRSELIEHCWDEFADPMSNVVDVRVASLRRRLGIPEFVHTVRGLGYTVKADGT